MSSTARCLQLCCYEPCLQHIRKGNSDLQGHEITAGNNIDMHERSRLEWPRKQVGVKRRLSKILLLSVLQEMLLMTHHRRCCYEDVADDMTCC